MVGFLVLVMSIPLSLVHMLVWERKHRYEQVQTDISQHWGQAQGVIGPALFIPFRRDPKKPQEYVVLLPDKLTVKGQVYPEIRRRGIFQSVVYRTQMTLEASYAPKAQLTLVEGILPHFEWQRSTLGLSLNDSKGLLSGTSIELNGKPIEGLQPADAFSGIQAPVDLTRIAQGQPITLKINLELNGSRVLGFSPVGKESRVLLTGAYNRPSFNGEYLPTKRNVSTDGFEADWTISHLSRSFPQSWRQNAVSLPTLGMTLMNGAQDDYPRSDNLNQGQDISRRLQLSGFGVALMEPVDAYKQTERSLKYGMLFLAMTFITYFLFERLTRVNIHLLQYVMVGLALSLFYLIVLSVSELWGFPVAYTLATLATVSLISYYSASFIPRKQQFVMPTVLTGIYAYLYSLLQLEDYSLLFGTLGLFIILAVLMMTTRNIHNQPE